MKKSVKAGAGVSLINAEGDIAYETERLVVRKWRAGDAADLYEYCSDPEVTKFLTFPTYKDISDAHARLRDMADLDLSGKIAGKDFAIELKCGKDRGKVIGSVGWVNYCEKHGGIIEVGYMLNRRFHGAGYMTEVLVGMFQYIKSRGIAMRIEAKHDPENPTSGAVMRRAGMAFEGVRRKSATNNTGDRVDMYIYSILAEEIHLP